LSHILLALNTQIAGFDTLYEWQSERRRNRPEFVLHDGPPYANGDIHLGHLVNKVLKDICLRYKLLRGHRVEYVPGWDCHGLPIELNAAKSLKKAKKMTTKTTKQQSDDSESHYEKASPLDIRRMARSYALKCIDRQMSSFKQMGLLADWNNVYRTMDPAYMCNQVDLFGTLHADDLIYRDYMPVYWSVSSQSALAESELEYNEEHNSSGVFVAYELAERPEAIRHALS
jgi:isoleucyl-tRNA synthetase